MIFDDLIGKPYKENGRGPDGYDCYGLVEIVSRRLGIDLPAFGLLCLEAMKHRFIKVSKPEAGDIVFVPPGHVGIMENKNTMLQVMDRHPVHRMRINHPWIKDRIEGFYRYAG